MYKMWGGGSGVVVRDCDYFSCHMGCCVASLWWTCGCENENVTCTVKTTETITLRCCCDVQTVHICWMTCQMILFCLCFLTCSLCCNIIVCVVCELNKGVIVLPAFQRLVFTIWVPVPKTHVHTPVFSLSLPSDSIQYIYIWRWGSASLFGRSSRVPASVGSLLVLLLGSHLAC